MQRTRIKFCGITKPQDAIAAANAGADAIGLIFYEQSRRFVTIELAREILAVLPPMVTPIGLFLNARPSKISQTASSLHLRTVQLHGEETPDYLEQLPGLSIIKAIRCTSANLADLSAWKEVSGILLETPNTPEAGGSGIANDWSLVERLIASGTLKDAPPLIAAGGLTPGNVAEVVRRIHPWAVDVSSGIEESPGIKSLEKMRRFVDQVRHAP